MVNNSYQSKGLHSSSVLPLQPHMPKGDHNKKRSPFVVDAPPAAQFTVMNGGAPAGMQMQTPVMAATPVIGGGNMQGPPAGAMPHPMMMPGTYTMGQGHLQPPGAAMNNGGGSRPGSRGSRPNSSNKP